MKGKKGYVYRIKLSQNMLVQGYEDFDGLEFENFDKAYSFVASKWGSGVVNVPLGLNIQKRKIGNKDWIYAMNA